MPSKSPSSEHQDLGLAKEITGLSVETGGPTLRAVFGPNCDKGPCPTIYQDETGDYVIQGYKVAPTQRAGADVPAHEDLVRVPADFLEKFIQSKRTKP